VPADPYSSEAAMQAMELALDQFQLADEVGFDWVTTAEHHYAPFSMTPNPMVMAGAVTQRVHRAKIALLGPTIPILNPVRVAEELAMVDTLSHGRLVAGMLRGTANEYATYNVNPAESRERFAEALALIRAAWTEPQPFGWQGRYFQYRGISIWPRPVQQPHPPIFMSGSSPEAGEFAARNHLKLGFAVTTVPLAKEAARHYRAQALESGWEPEPDDILYRVAALVTETDDEAMEALNQGPGRTPALDSPALEAAIARSGYFGRDEKAQRRRRRLQRPLEERIALGALVAGSPETVLGQIRTIRDELGAGIIEVVIGAGPAPAELARQRSLRAIELFGTKVIPGLREL
jgi:alkanesulfonate monooxygenase SsuD/methylene tetrahydromethanopterin reductase-like flavin-dependent oxidoreductase (luciferase family)